MFLSYLARYGKVVAIKLTSSSLEEIKSFAKDNLISYKKERHVGSLLSVSIQSKAGIFVVTEGELPY